MKTILKKIILKTLMVLSFCLGLLILFLLNPSLLYAHQTVHKNMTIYHNQPMNEQVISAIDISLETIKNSEIYDETLKSDICLNDGSFYPKLVQSVLGDDVFTAFSNKVVVLGSPSNHTNRFHKWDREMKYSQFLSHALLHNLQFKHHGFFDANPLGNYPKWKWEGYVEYEVLGHTVSLDDLILILKNKDLSDYEWVELKEGDGTIKMHIKYLAMTKYCLDVLKWDYTTFMTNNRGETEIYEALLSH